MQSLLQRVFSYNIHPSGCENIYTYLSTCICMYRWKLLDLLISACKLKNIYIYFEKSLAVSGLDGRTGFFPSRAGWGCSGCSMQARRCCGFSCCSAWAPCVQASVIAARGLSSRGSQDLEHRLRSRPIGLAALWHVGSSWTRIEPMSPALPQGILHHWATRGALHLGICSV